ncbi:hypothetical protein PF327_01995 [Sulfurovum sp. XTW-4]|uniref:Uncharacterized protein n=1 Tax=Sulfurovum xiamenensis TaxID=3019066 RepID=A0ABT7QPM0_9BACT|nr:hypothetical protein [Sulfurovum xiamenensis]MDM5262961.1 hypothetical protein [Sulfurovum xiamenensis]
MSINTINISKMIKLNVLIRLLNNHELFDVACSKSGLSLSNAKQLLDNTDLIKQQNLRP